MTIDNEMWYIRSTDYYSAIKRYEILCMIPCGWTVETSYRVKEAKRQKTYSLHYGPHACGVMAGQGEICIVCQFFT